jgi:hypothetical protein
MFREGVPMTEDDQVEVIAAVIDAFFEEADVDTFESEDLARAIVLALQRATSGAD